MGYKYCTTKWIPLYLSVIQQKDVKCDGSRILENQPEACIKFQEDGQTVPMHPNFGPFGTGWCDLEGFSWDFLFSFPPFPFPR